jgi:TorA maturation chaperone TorD
MSALVITAQREDAYRLLAACYYPPTAAFFAEECAMSLATVLEGLSPEACPFAREAAEAMKTTVPEALAVEHARLFLGPFHLVAPPYGSVYLDEPSTVMGDSTVRVAAFYDSCGLHLADDCHELPDHIAVELEFLSYLAFKEREAVSSGDAAEADRFRARHREFLDRFLLPWLGPFTAAIINDGEAPFYQAIARCTAAFVRGDGAPGHA